MILGISSLKKKILFPKESYKPAYNNIKKHTQLHYSAVALHFEDKVRGKALSAVPRVELAEGASLV